MAAETWAEDEQRVVLSAMPEVGLQPSGIRRHSAADCAVPESVHRSVRHAQAGCARGGVLQVASLAAAARARVAGFVARHLLFSYCARGMAFVDIAFLRRDDICGDWFSYVRRKTGQRLTVRIEPPMAAIINRYKNEAGEYVFPIISADGQDAYRQYQTALGYHNRKLKQLAEIAGISEKLSTYTARHSWATAARRHNVPLSIISAGLGHSSERTTLIYLDSVENVALDNANHEILKCL